MEKSSYADEAVRRAWIEHYERALHTGRRFGKKLTAEDREILRDELEYLTDH